VAFAQLRFGDDGRGEGKIGRGAAFCAGFCTAATNPLTLAFFAAQSAAAGPLGAATLGGVAAMALGFYLGMAALMANGAARRAALRWQRPIRLASAAALLVSAGAMLRPLVLR
jgi:threonine/homoserine/homoserine lactone efflux protein